MYQLILMLVYFAYILVMSFITLVLYGRDKKLSRGGDIRIKEKTLLAMAAAGGALGAFAARYIFSHKTKKLYFSIVIGVSLVLQALVLLAMLLSVIVVL